MNPDPKEVHAIVEKMAHHLVDCARAWTEANIAELSEKNPLLSMSINVMAMQLAAEGMGVAFAEQVHTARSRP